jgi:SAM-dependent methyltransferase
MDPRYAFAFGSETPYGHVLDLMQRLRPRPGAVLDLGCGYGALAEPITAEGYEYVGADLDEEALAAVSARGFETHLLDLQRYEDLPDRLIEVSGSRRISAVLLLDVVEHLSRTDAALHALRKSLDELGRPPLIVSIPNIAHVDVAAKLVFGRFDYTETGLLDRTHVSFFTFERLHAATRACGLIEIAERDFRLEASDQRFPAGHPSVVRGGPAAELMRMWRTRSDVHGFTSQFIRAYVPGDFERRELQSGTKVSPLTVVTRTQGRRLQMLRDTLTCLAAQTLDTFDVFVMVHTDEPDSLRSVERLVMEFDETFAGRVKVMHVPDKIGSRARPLNAALDSLEGDYVTFLDDDDLVTANWAEVFCSAAGDGAIVRSVSAVRDIRTTPEGSDAPYEITSGLQFCYEPTFDLARHLWQNQSPICSYAVPRSLIETLRLRFDEDLVVLEDWDFLLRCASMVPIRDTGKLTSIYQMWTKGESSASLHDATLWSSVARVLQERMDAEPLVLPAGAVRRVVALQQRLLHVDNVCEEQRRKIEYLTQEHRALFARYETVIESRRWRFAATLGRLPDGMRRMRFKAGRWKTHDQA